MVMHVREKQHMKVIDRKTEKTELELLDKREGFVSFLFILGEKLRWDHF